MDVSPFTTREVRWFFVSDSPQARALEHWFEATAPLRQEPAVSQPVWQNRAGDEPDTYLVLPGYENMGIKWREGLLQIKGRIEASAIATAFGAHQGRIERWIKWSYAGLPAAYRNLLQPDSGNRVRCVAVHKRRAIRLAAFDLAAKSAHEVETDTQLDRGLVIELAAVRGGEHRFLTLCFEAFPDSEAIQLLFKSTVETFVADLTAFSLDDAHSLSYPAWLARLPLT